MFGPALQAGAVRARQGLLAVVLVLICAPAFTSGPENDSAELVRIKADIVKMIGTARCRNLVHCRLLPLGLDRCGAPSEYLAYSSGFTDITALETRASEYAFVQEELLAGKPPVTGECKPRPEPQAVCIDHHCKVLQAPQ